MCIKYIYNLCFKNNDYNDIVEMQEEITVLDKCVILLKEKDPELVLKYTSDCIIFSKSFIPWYNTVKPDLKNFLDYFKQIEVDPTIKQLIFFYKIPIHYHERFLYLLKIE
jgi:hypothetical protein